MVRSLALFFALTSNLYGQVVLSEILSNEPGGRVRLEWIEVYNRSLAEIDLHDYYLIVDGDSSRLSAGSLLDGGAYAIVARQLLATDGSDSFEGHWGDSSGVWGDWADEYYSAFDCDFQLGNNSGAVILADSSGSRLDSCSWNTASDDGRSIERDDLFDDFSGWHDCFDPEGSTPGMANSAIPPSGAESFAVDVSPRLASRNGNGSAVQFNISVVIPPGSKATVEVFDDSGLKRKLIAEDVQLPVANILWDGAGDNGRSLPPGLYILTISLSGQKTEHKFIPVVIAP